MFITGWEAAEYTLTLMKASHTHKALNTVLVLLGLQSHSWGFWCFSHLIFVVFIAKYAHSFKSKDLYLVFRCIQSFAVRSLGWVEMAEEDLAPGKSSVAVNNCIRQLSYCKNDIRDTVGIWGEVYNHSLCVIHVGCKLKGGGGWFEWISTLCKLRLQKFCKVNWPQRESFLLLNFDQVFTDTCVHWPKSEKL